MASVTITITDDENEKVSVSAQFSGTGMSTVYPSHCVALEMIAVARQLADEEGDENG